MQLGRFEIKCLGVSPFGSFSEFWSENYDWVVIGLGITETEALNNCIKKFREVSGIEAEETIRFAYGDDDALSGEYVQIRMRWDEV